MRLFIAIQLNDEVRESVRETQDAFRRQGVRGNYTSAENLHLTKSEMEQYFGDVMAIEGVTYDSIKAA